MAQLKDLIVNGASRFIGDIFGNKAQLTTLEAPTSAGGTTYGPGSNGQVLKSNGSSLYWANDNNSDTNVTQTITSTTNADYRVLFSGTADDTTRTEGARKDTDFKWNPSTNTLTAANIAGNAATATKATQDANGNVITSTYVKKAGDTMTGNLTANGTATLGTAANPWHQLVLGGATNATMTADSTNPKITFGESNNGSQPVHIIYSDYDSYRAPAGLKIIGGTSASPAWLEVEGQIYGARFNGPVTGDVTGNATTATKAKLTTTQNALAYYSNTNGTFADSGIVIIPSSKHIGGWINGGQKSGTTLGSYVTAEGYDTTASGNYTHAEGCTTVASNYCAHAEGSYTTASGYASHTEGESTNATNDYAHAEGYATTAGSRFTHAEGLSTTANGWCGHAEGDHTTASTYAHAEGYYTTASGDCSSAIGDNTTASGTGSHSEGYHTTASGNYSHAEGYYTIAEAAVQHVFGQYNKPDTGHGNDSASRGSYVEIVGNGVDSSSKSNARTLDWNGNERLAGSLLPMANNFQTLGNTTYKWQKLYIGTADSYGDAYTPVYWNDGVPTAVSIVQKVPFTINSGKKGVILTHASFTVNSYVIQIIITSGESNLGAGITWTSAGTGSTAGTITLNTTVAVGGNVSGYILVIRGSEISDATSADVS